MGDMGSYEEERGRGDQLKVHEDLVFGLCSGGGGERDSLALRMSGKSTPESLPFE